MPPPDGVSSVRSSGDRFRIANESLGAPPPRSASVIEPRQPGFAPIGLTLPRAPARSASVSSSSEPDPHLSTGAQRSTSTASRTLSESEWLPSPRQEARTAKEYRKNNNRLGLNLDNVAENIDKARNAGVQPARNTWVKKMAGVAVAGLFTLGLVAAGVATGGAAFFGAAAVSGLMLTKMSADAICAKLLLNDARKEAAGEGLVMRRLPMGADSLGNLIHWTLPNSWSPDTRTKVAGVTSFILNLGIATASTIMSGGALALPAAITVGVGYTGLFVWSAATHGLKSPELKDADGVMLNHFIEVQQQAEALMDELLQRDDLPVADRARLMTQLKTAQERVLGTMAANVDRMAEQIENATLLHGRQVERFRSEFGKQGRDWVLSQVGVKTALDPVLVAGKLLFTGAEALSAYQERKVQLEDVNTFHAVASEVKAELSKAREQAAIAQPNLVERTEPRVAQDIEQSPDELLADSLMQAQLRNI